MKTKQFKKFQDRLFLKIHEPVKFVLIEIYDVDNEDFINTKGHKFISNPIGYTFKKITDDDFIIHIPINKELINNLTPSPS